MIVAAGPLLPPPLSQLVSLTVTALPPSPFRQEAMANMPLHAPKWQPSRPWQEIDALSLLPVPHFIQHHPPPTEEEEEEEAEEEQRASEAQVPDSQGSGSAWQGGDQSSRGGSEAGVPAARGVDLVAEIGWRAEQHPPHSYPSPKQGQASQNPNP